MQPVQMGRGKAEELEHAHVYSVYDQIAESFSKISQKAWPNVRRFLKQQPPGSLVADIGCGNGRYLHINKNIYKVGLDICCPLVEAGKIKGYEVLIADNLKLPFRGESFDAVISIGVLHHFATGSRRIEAIQEMSRILRPGGQLMIYVWAYEQKHRKFDGQDVLVPWHDSPRNNSTGTQRTFSDRDLSSASSFSEDESSIDAADEFFFTCIDDIPVTNGNGILQDDDVFIEIQKKDMLPVKSLASKRSNTLPNLIEGNSVLRAKGIKDGLNTKNRARSSSLLIEECRKFEASLSAMTAQHDEAGAPILVEELQCDGISKGELSVSEQPTLSISLENRRGSTKDSNWLSRLPSSESLTALKQQRTQEYVLHLSDPVSQSSVPDDDDDMDSYIIFETHPESNCSSLKAKSMGFPLQFYDSRLISNNQSSGKSQYSHEHKDTILTGGSRAKKNTSHSLFGNIKQKFKKFFEVSSSNNEPRKNENILSKGTASPKSSLLPQSLINQMMAEDLDGFAVREFPMSSRPLPQEQGPQKCQEERTADTAKEKKTLSFNTAETVSKEINASFSKTHSFGTEVNSTPAFSSQGHTKEMIKCKNGVSKSVDKVEKLESQRKNIDLRNLPRRTQDSAQNQQFTIFTNGKSFSECQDSVVHSSDLFIPSQKYSSLSKNSNSQIQLGCDKTPSDLCRFYHVFREGELVKMINMHVPSLRVVQCIYDHANWCVIAEKLDD